MEATNPTSEVPTVTVALSVEASGLRHVYLPISCTIGDVKEQISLARSMTDSTGYSIDVGRITIKHNDTILADETHISDIPADRFLVVEVCAPDASDDPLEESLEIGEITHRLRLVTRADVPLAQHRHMLQERQRTCSAAVLAAFSRTRKSSKVNAMIEEPVWEASCESNVHYKDLTSACESFIELLETRPGTTETNATRVNEFADAILATLSFVLMESDAESEQIDSGRSLADILNDPSINPVELAAGLVSEVQRTPVNERPSPLPIIDRLVTEISQGSSLSQIAETLSQLVCAYVNKCASPTQATGGSLLGAPAHRASLSPELRRWAQGLRRPNP